MKHTHNIGVIKHICGHSQDHGIVGSNYAGTQKLIDSYERQKCKDCKIIDNANHERKEKYLIEKAKAIVEGLGIKNASFSTEHHNNSCEVVFWLNDL